jgi:HEAT repeat protein
MSLGRLKAERAVDPLAATLAGDRSPAVRDAAARALGLVGSPRGLTALKYAAQADSDRDVRHSAQFAVEIIQSRMKR